MLADFTTDQLLEIAERETAHLINADDREDAKQEFILGVLEAQERGDPEREGYRAYLWSYGRGRVLSFLTKQTKFNYNNNRSDINLHEVPEYAEEPLIDRFASVDADEDQLIVQEQKEQIQAAIASLPDNKQTIINEYFWNGQTLEGIGEILGVSKERVRQLKEDALEKLQYVLA